jgi:hypothetical protein
MHALARVRKSDYNKGNVGFVQTRVLILCTLHAVHTQLLYVAPEKLLNPSVLNALRKLERIPLVRFCFCCVHVSVHDTCWRPWVHLF